MGGLAILLIHPTILKVLKLKRTLQKAAGNLPSVVGGTAPPQEGIVSSYTHLYGYQTLNCAEGVYPLFLNLSAIWR